LKILERPRECLVKSFEHLKAIIFGSLQEEVNRRRKCPVEKNGPVEKKGTCLKEMIQRKTDATTKYGVKLDNELDFQN
jgi:hypothetical protein